MNEQDIMANVIPLTDSDVARILEAWKADIEDGEQNVTDRVAYPGIEPDTHNL